LTYGKNVSYYLYMAPEARSKSPPTTLLTKQLHQNVQQSKQSRRTATVSSAKGMVELSDDLRLVMYGLGALVASVDGVTDSETLALRTIADFLHVSDRMRKDIDKSLRQASSMAAGLVALFDAYQAVRTTYRKAGSTQAQSADRAVQTQQVRGLAQENIFTLPMLDADQVSELLGSRSQNQRQYAAALRRRGALLGLRRGNRYLYPKFQFDPKTRQVYPVIQIVGKVLDAGHDPWGAVSWWTSPNPRLRDQRAPMDLLAKPDASADLPSLARSMVATIG